MLVGDRMRRDVVTIDRETSLRRAWRVMAHHRIRHLPVVEGRHLVGVVTDRDLRQASPSSVTSLTSREREEFLDFIRVGQIMTRRLVTVTPETPVGDAAQLLLRHRVGCLPVVTERILVGIMTSSDLLEVLVQILRAEGGCDRLEVEVPDETEELATLLRIAETHRARIINLVSIPAGERFAKRAFLAFEGDPEVLCAALDAAGFRVALYPAPAEAEMLLLEHLGRS
jgi:acetoin utilization protein AcuB